MVRVRWIMVGGFLGAGKTTLLGRAARRIADTGKNVVLITNDQADGLVDTGSLKVQGFPVREIAGGCFCCRFDALATAADRILDELEPDIILGEPVGSCTDISATVLQPLKDLYGDVFRLAPFTVLADPGRLAELVGGGEASFPDPVEYIFRKQLEEADVIGINKVDRLAESERAILRTAVGERFPDTPLLEMSALHDRGIEEWLDLVLGEEVAGRRVASVDYDAYAAGEALLGWLNAVVEVRSRAAVEWRDFCRALLEEIRGRCQARNAEIAHVKLLLQWAGGAIVGNVTANREPPSVRDAPSSGACLPGAHGVLTVNARVHLAPEALDAIVRQALRDAAGEAVAMTLVDIQSFRPGRPEPRHRYGAPVGG